MDPRIVTYSQKQTRGVQLTESDKSDLIDVYFEQCSTLYQSKFRKREVSIIIELVTYPGECESTDKNKIFDSIEKKVQKSRKTIRIIVYIVAGIGLVGNLLCISVFCRPSYIATYRISYYCIARSFSDCLMLIFCIISIYAHDFEFGHKKDGDETYQSTDPIEDYLWILQCVFVFAGFMVSEICSALCTLAISIERLISVAFPLKAKVYLTHRIARRATFGVVCASVLIPLVFFLATYLPKGIDFGEECFNFISDQRSEEFLYFTSIWTGIVILLPWLSILIVTAITLSKLGQASRRRQEMTSANNQNAAQNDPNRRTKVMSLVLALGFLVALIPEIINNFVAILQASNLLGNMYLAVQFYNVFIILLAVKGSMAFFLCFATNAEFRQKILRYFKVCVRCNRCATAT